MVDHCVLDVMQKKAASVCGLDTSLLDARFREKWTSERLALDVDASVTR
jgi:hypothetical protein